MQTKFQANTNRFDYSNMSMITASSDFQYWTDFNNGAIFLQIVPNLKSTCLNTLTRHMTIQTTY